MSVPTGARKSLPHGTVSGYINWACRCEECRQASRDYYGHKPMAEHLAEVEAQHGTESRYKRCDCDECRAASAAARRARRRNANPARHGLYASYSNGCRCAECREAKRVASALRRAKQAA